MSLKPDLIDNDLGDVAVTPQGGLALSVDNFYNAGPATATAGHTNLTFTLGSTFAGTAAVAGYTNITLTTPTTTSAGPIAQTAQLTFTIGSRNTAVVVSKGSNFRTDTPLFEVEYEASNKRF